jgi:hypothetical protein
MKPTEHEYNGFQQAYDYFNGQLFSNALPQVLVTLQRKSKAYGYFSPERFTTRSGKLIDTIAGDSTVHELALNPDHFTGRSDEAILSTLVHEMCHVWQQTHGKAPRRCYHDRQFANKMKEVGLQASDTGAPGGKEVGQKMSHYIIRGGAFQIAYRSLVKTHGYELRYQSRPEEDSQAAAKRASKTKYECPSCDLAAWAKPGANLLCGDCSEDDELVKMEPVETGEEKDQARAVTKGTR